MKERYSEINKKQCKRTVGMSRGIMASKGENIEIMAKNIKTKDLFRVRV